MPYLLTTPRLGLRRWQPADLGPFAQLNADAAVREFFPTVMTRAQTAESITRLETHFDQYGYGFYALDVLDTREFIGFTGLQRLDSFEAWFVPCVEIGWRLRREAWGRGYAPEAAQICLEYAWNELKLDKLYAYTAEHNAKSRRVMQKIGMTMAGHFDHPKIAAGHPLQRHVVYEIQPTHL
ncbi:MAG TPA: GNAT family N-acetyltransferase [Puia sp.]|nr:GNAT family N-acetyltransferase [Puia sp.]